MIKQKHGISEAAKVAATNSDYYQSVLITDEYSRVRITLGACAYPADMTPDQARGCGP